MAKNKTKISINRSIVKDLIEEQFPHFSSLPLELVNSAGTDHVLFRLGKEKVIRLPKFHRVADQGEKEHTWLPRLAPFLPLEIPTPIEKGTPSKDYPLHWSIYSWIEGEMASSRSITDLRSAAISIAQFINALQKIDPAKGPLSGKQNEFRGFTLAHQNPYARVAIETLKGIFNPDTLTSCWQAALRAPLWEGSGVFLHGDLHEGNLLAQNGTLSAVIDFGLLGVGAPASDLMVAWTLLSPETREIFRKELTLDEATWQRGRGWALSFGLIALACYLHTNPTLAQIAKKTIEQVLSD